MKGQNKKSERMKIILGSVAAALLLVFVFWFNGYMDKHHNLKGRQGGLQTLEQAAPQELVVSGITKWSYQEDGQVPDEGWMLPEFDVAGWKTGAGSFGSVNGERVEMVNDKFPRNLLNHYTEEGAAVPVYLFRTEIELNDITGIKLLSGQITFDDSVVIYLNGIKIFEGNTPENGYDTNLYGASQTVDDSMTKRFTLEDLTMLRPGKNILAVELHQANANSSDVYFDFESLTGTNEGEGQKDLNTESLILEVGNTPESVRVNWLSEDKGNYEVQVAIRDKESKRFPEEYISSLMNREEDEEAGVYNYSAVLEPLGRGVEYVYRIKELGKNALSKIYTLYIQPESDTFSFLFAGDPQLGADALNRDGVGWKKILDKGIQFAPDAAFIITAGDQVDSSGAVAARDEYMEFRKPEILKKLPVAVNRGNHESGSLLYDIQFNRQEQIGHDYYFIYNDVLFVSLNSNSTDYEVHEAFLKSAIEKTDHQWVVVTMHHSIFSAGKYGNAGSMMERREKFAQMFKELDVDLVLSGHDHIYSRSYLMSGTEVTGKRDGQKSEGETLYITGGSSTGSKFYEKDLDDLAHIAYRSGKNKACIVTVQVSGNSLTVKMYQESSPEAEDICTITK